MAGRFRGGMLGNVLMKVQGFRRSLLCRDLCARTLSISSYAASTGGSKLLEPCLQLVDQSAITSGYHEALIVAREINASRIGNYLSDVDALTWERDLGKLKMIVLKTESSRRQPTLRSQESRSRPIVEVTSLRRQGEGKPPTLLTYYKSRWKD